MFHEVETFLMMLMKTAHSFNITWSSAPACIRISGSHPLSLFLFSTTPGDGGDDSESKTVWRDHSREFDFGAQLCATDKPTNVISSASPAAHSGLRHARSVKPGRVGLLDAWSFKVLLSYASPTVAALFRRLGRWDREYFCQFRNWIRQGLVEFSLVSPPRPYRHRWPHRSWGYWDSQALYHNNRIIGLLNVIGSSFYLYIIYSSRLLDSIIYHLKNL